MTLQRFATCFIAAPLGVDTRPLRTALSTRGVDTTDLTDVLTRGPAPVAIKRAIAAVDFVCAVVPDGPPDPYVMLEIGVAIGTGRPSLLFIGATTDLPVPLRAQPFARASLDDAESIGFHLDIFLKHAAKRPGTNGAAEGDELLIPAPTRLVTLLDQLAAWEARPTPPSETELLSFLLEAFEEAGYITSAESLLAPPRADRVDAAVWVDELEGTIGNPLVIEIALHRATLTAKAEHLRAYLREMEDSLGVLISWEPADSSATENGWTQPLIVVMSAREVIEALGRGDLARTILTHRYAAVHSAA